MFSLRTLTNQLHIHRHTEGDEGVKQRRSGISVPLWECRDTWLMVMGARAELGKDGRRWLQQHPNPPLFRFGENLLLFTDSFFWDFLPRGVCS